jgi:hypothetical protein
MNKFLGLSEVSMLPLRISGRMKWPLLISPCRSSTLNNFYIFCVSKFIDYYMKPYTLWKETSLRTTIEKERVPTNKFFRYVIVHSVIMESGIVLVV